MTSAASMGAAAENIRGEIKKRCCEIVRCRVGFVKAATTSQRS